MRAFATRQNEDGDDAGSIQKDVVYVPPPPPLAGETLVATFATKQQ